MRSYIAPWLLAATFALPVDAQSRPLGPADAQVLPPTDTARVAVGQLAPDFTLATKEGGTVTLSDYRGKKRIILVFYRGHW
ncbi:MAG: redoxin domain-containing protein [Gemmatimonadetes bacterium]|nr:redoxin domain-containing protein [Gemmatimonadota bacterium]